MPGHTCPDRKLLRVAIHRSHDRCAQRGAAHGKEVGAHPGQSDAVRRHAGVEDDPAEVGAHCRTGGALARAARATAAHDGGLGDRDRPETRELFALRWKDIDEQRQLLTVREAIYDGKFSTPKTAAGLRQVPLSELALDLIRQWNPRAASTESEALVFATSAGTPILPANVLYRSITPACKAAGLPKATWLTVRRTTRHGHTRRMYRARWWRS
jgi:integrase